MKEKKHQMLQDRDKSAVMDRLKSTLEEHYDILFAYVHGSFLKGGTFRDIDLAMYLKEMPASSLEYELAFEAALAQSTFPFPVDVRVLNKAPLSFKYNVIKNGHILIVRDDNARSDFQEITLSHYFDFAPFRSLYLKETLGIGA